MNKSEVLKEESGLKQGGYYDKKENAYVHSDFVLFINSVFVMWRIFGGAVVCDRNRRRIDGLSG